VGKSNPHDPQVARFSKLARQAVSGYATSSFGSPSWNKYGRTVSHWDEYVSVVAKDLRRNRFAQEQSVLIELHQARDFLDRFLAAYHVPATEC